VVAVSFASLKQDLSLAAVAMKYGVELAPRPGGRLVGLCPFHADTNPSLELWPAGGIWRWSCFPCQSSGDLFDFLAKWHECDFRDAMAIAKELRERGLEPGPIAEGHTYGDDFDTLEWLMHRAEEDLAPQPTAVTIEQALAARGVTVPVDWLRQEFNVVSDKDGLLVPHYNRYGKLRAIKRRIPPTWRPPISVRGSNLSHLYGAWRDIGDPLIVLCEGESDTWSMAYMLREKMADVVGLPSGVHRPMPDWLDEMRDRHVILILDADEPGLRCMAAWAQALKPVARSIRMAELPSGLDVTAAGPDLCWRALRGSITV
jgi:DNA primase